MAYFEPFIDASGYHYPTFAECKEYLVESAKEIFGADIYVDDDSMDGQDISIRAKAMYDTFKVGEFAYNNNSPASAIGTALAKNVLLNGMKVKASGFSTVYVKLTGTPYTTILNGVVSDTASNKWNLPSSCNLGSGGTLYVTATAQKQGNITAMAGTVINIDTPTFGWTSVTNESVASPGQETETDGQVRLRQTQAVALPSQALLEGTQSAILQVSGVTDAIVKENDTDAPVVVQGVTLPKNSITCIVKGGSEDETASTIFYKKNQGCYTNGDIEKTVFDIYANVNTIRFFRPVGVPVKVQIGITPIKGYSSSITDAIEANVFNHIDSLGISQDLIQSIISSIINKSITDLDDPEFYINDLQIAKVGSSFGTSNVIMNLNEEATIDLSNITITVAS